MITWRILETKPVNISSHLFNNSWYAFQLTKHVDVHSLILSTQSAMRDRSKDKSLAQGTIVAEMKRNLRFEILSARYHIVPIFNVFVAIEYMSKKDTGFKK